MLLAIILASDSFPDTIAVCKTWFEPSVILNFDAFNNYVLIETIMEEELCYLFLKTLCFKIELNKTNITKIWCKFKKCNEHLSISCVYRPPHSNILLLKNLSAYISQMCSDFPNDRIYIFVILI